MFHVIKGEKSPNVIHKYYICQIMIRRSLNKKRVNCDLSLKECSLVKLTILIGISMKLVE